MSVTPRIPGGQAPWFQLSQVQRATPPGPAMYFQVPPALGHGVEWPPIAVIHCLVAHPALFASSLMGFQCQ
jgi:hypothetical protein